MPVAVSAPFPARTRHRVARGWLLLGLLLAAWPALATPLSAYEHTAWVVGQGAPGDVWDIAQPADGSLLLATGTGLYRFDGRQFERPAPPNGSTFPSSNMTTLALDPDGTLWIAYYNAGISRLDRHGLTHYAQAQGLPPGLVPRIERDGSGRLWAAADGGLRWFDGERWQVPTAAMGIGDVPAQWLLRDQTGTLWVIAAGRLWRLPANAARFEPLALPVAPFSSLALRDNGQVWLADRRRGVMPVADARGLLPATERDALRRPTLLAKRIRFAADGSLWGSLVDSGGIFRLDVTASAAAPVERFDAAQGLASTTAVPVLADREGTLWVGTNLGLNRFRPHQVRSLALSGPADPLRTLYHAPDGQVFAYGADLRPMALRRTLLQAPSTDLHRAALASDQPLWVVDWEALLLIRDGQPHELHPPGVPAPRELRAVLPLGRDEAWFCFGDQRVMHYLRGRWDSDPALPGHACTTLAAGPAGAVLMGYPDGELRVRRQQAWRHYTRADGLQVGPITATAMIGARIWVAGENGLALLGDDDRFHAAQTDTPGLLEGITGIVRDRTAYYWFNGSRGLLRIDASTLEQAVLHGRPVEPRLFDRGDGMPGIAVQTTPMPSAMLAADGLLWLSTNQGLAWIDTGVAQRAGAALQPRIGDVSHGQTQQPLRDGMVLPAGTAQLQIDYLALALSRPERTRYRYRLIGLDDHWQDAGTLTRAFYTNLPPGRYRFEVIAANQDMVWSPVAATRSFHIAPMWYQTLWFNAACVVLLLALILLAMRLRSRRLTQLVRARLQERHAERERIARELHDTLLQGTQGLILRLHAVSQASHTPPPVRAALEAAMQQAESALAEGRDRVSALRDDSDGYQDLGAALVQVYGERASDASSPALRLNVEGAPLPLRRAAAEEVYLIGREALLNALQHAHAGAIEIELGYGMRGLRLHVRDDGRGLPETMAEGHWGLVGMRERAERLGARLRLWSRPGLGTEVELFLPRHRIYRRSPRRWRWPRFTGESA